MSITEPTRREPKSVTPQVAEIEMPSSVEAHIAVHKQLTGEIEHRLAVLGIFPGDLYEAVNLNEHADERLHSLFTRKGDHRVGWWRIVYEVTRNTFKIVGRCGVIAERYWEWTP